ncbi:hypothetical protein jhhlp_005496 [Lomentospora prolificans]|uniref:FAD-binding domain-containing protein n=1 Tax=Lomentospora prolificans TaxID=41688 RepID=A0A2N3N392_9PEZI|nr:hypothetical protein jhhlp_005496 [Lomentospora prolificans]
MSSFTVAIIGAGPVGCTLARLLHQANIDVTVFEGEATFNARDQGGTLDLHTTTGLLAMKDAGIWENFQKHARYEGQALIIADRHGKDFLKRSPSGAADALEERPEIDRVKLREILIESLPEGMIKWGHRLAKVDEDKTLHFTDSTTASGFDLVVGVEGAWSKVRNLLNPDLKPVFAEVGHFSFKTSNMKEAVPEAYKFVNHGSVFAFADGLRVSMQELGDGSLSMSVAFALDSDNWIDPAWTLEDVKEKALEKLDDWAPVFKEGIKTAESFMARSLYQLPVGATWEHKKGVTLAGDAAHLMTPFAGEGVNIGMKDALVLAKEIIAAVKEGGDADVLDKHLKAYEKEMFARAKVIQKLTDDLRKDYLFSKGVPGSIMARAMSRHVKLHTPWVLHPVATAVVYGYFFFRNFGS